jgi:hypothetical protein
MPWVALQPPRVLLFDEAHEAIRTVTVVISTRAINNRFILRYFDVKRYVADSANQKESDEREIR